MCRWIKENSGAGMTENEQLIYTILYLHEELCERKKASTNKSSL